MSSSSNNASASKQLLNPMQLQKVDSAFEELFGYSWGTHFHLEPSTHTEMLLSEILGVKAAARILQRKDARVTTTTTKRRRDLSSSKTKPVAHKKQQNYKAKQPAIVKVPAVPPKEASSDNTKKPAPIPPVKKPAPGTSATAAASGGVDNLLQQLNEKKITTITKTSVDWDQFKEKTGLGEHLEEKAESSTAYLKKQDFLNRVDNRTFEIERKERDRDRAKRGS